MSFPAAERLVVDTGPGTGFVPFIFLHAVVRSTVPVTGLNPTPTPAIRAQGSSPLRLSPVSLCTHVLSFHLGQATDV